MIVETNSNQFFKVRETVEPDLAHLFWGVPVKRMGAVWVPKKCAREQFVSKAHVLRKVGG